jgi:hypothetical protein
VFVAMIPSIFEASVTAAISSSSSSVRSGAIFTKTGIGSGQVGPRRHHALQDRLQRRWALQIAKPLGVGRRDVDGGEIHMRPAEAQHAREIAHAVGAVLVRAEVQPHRDAARTGAKTRRDGFGALVVEAEAVDRGAVLRQPEKPRAGVAGLGQGGRRPDLHKAEARAHQRIKRLGVLVVAGGETDGVGQREAGKIHAQTGRRTGPGRGTSPRRSA